MLVPQTFLLIQEEFLSNDVVKQLECLTELLAIHNKGEYIFSWAESNIPPEIFTKLFTEFLTSNSMQTYLAEKQFHAPNIDTVMYHANCSDGFGSAFVIWLYLKEISERNSTEVGFIELPAVTYIPCYFLKAREELNQVFLSKYQNKNIVMCDFSFRIVELLKIIMWSNSFLILDHHKTAEADLRHLLPALKVFDMKRSGVGITWDYFKPDHPLPKFLAMIQDRDLWEYKIPETTPFVAYFYEQPQQFDLWEKYLSDTEVNTAIEKGEQWRQYQDMIIQQLLGTVGCVVQEIDGVMYNVLYCNTSELKSDVGNRMLMTYPQGHFSVIWDYDIYKNQTLISLRSMSSVTKDPVDTSTIAKKMGGGGHKCASGVSIKGLCAVLPFPLLPTENQTQFSPLISSIVSDPTSESWIQYKDMIIGKILERASYIMQEINGKPLIVLYCNSPILCPDIFSKIIQKYPFGDLAVVWSFNSQTNQTSVSLRENNETVDILDIVHKLGIVNTIPATTSYTNNIYDADIHTVVLDSAVSPLPFPKFDDHGILSLIVSGIKGVVMSLNKEVPYTLFKIPELNGLWLTDPLLSILKDKHKMSHFLVFQIKSDVVKYNDKTQCIIALYDYHVLYNDRSENKITFRFVLESTGASEHILTFTSELEIDMILKKMLDTPTEQIVTYSSDEDYHDSGEDEDVSLDHASDENNDDETTSTEPTQTCDAQLFE